MNDAAFKRLELLQNLLFLPSEPFCASAHLEHIESLEKEARYNIFGHEFSVLPGMYHPHPWSSSVFMIRHLLRENRPLGKLLEVGCGSGVIAQTLVMRCLADHATLTDIDADSVLASGQNSMNLGIADRVAIHRGHLFDAVKGQCFDSVLFNLPLMHKNYTTQKHLSLDDPDGKLASEFFQKAPEFVKPGGSVYVTFSNLSDPELLTKHSVQFSFKLLAAEWVAQTGMSIMLYKCSLK